MSCSCRPYAEAYQRKCNIRLLEKATPDIALSKANDNEISQSGIDKFLDEEEEVLEDNSDNESAGGLSFRLG